MANRFEGNVVWVTGASSGIGAATARAFLEEGARVIVSARRRERLEAFRSSAGGNADRVAVVPLDLADAARMPECVERANGAFGTVDVVVHNGGISQRSRAVETSVEVDRRLMEVNYFGPVALTKALLPGWLERGRGQFVVVSSLVGRIGSPLRSGYAASKHALHGFFDSLRAEVATRGLHVTIVCPGFVQTDISLNALTGDGTAQDRMDDATARGITAEACARAIVGATAGRRVEITVGGFERAGVWLDRLSPALFARVLERAKVT